MNEALIQKIRGSASELDLADLFWSVLGKWRRILVCGLILAVLLGAFSAGRTFAHMKDPEYLQEVQLRNSEAVRVYEINRKECEGQISRYSEDLEQQEEYRAHSGLLSLDSFHVYVCEGIYFVDSGSSGLIDSLTREPNYTQAIIAAYSERLSSLDERQVLQNAGQIFSDAEIYNYRGFLNVSVDMESSTLRYKIYGATEEQVLAISDAVKALVRDTMPEISSLICEHSIALLNERVALQSDPELAALHADFETSLSETSQKLADAMVLMDTLESPQVELLSPAAAVTNALKLALLGFAIGAFLCACYEAFAFVVRGIVADPDDVTSRYGLRVLGVIPRSRVKNALDTRIASHYGIPAGMSEEEGLRYASVNLAEAARGEKTLLLTGSGDSDAVRALGAKLGGELPGLEIRTAGSICRDPEALKAFHACRNLVFAETLQQSRHNELRRELILALESGKTILGFLLMEKE